ncbi:MAG: DNA repair protein RecO [Candidatus Nealsonbacteria bacterium]
MANYYRTKGFILSKNNLQEADQVFNVYTNDFGNLKILGKSIRKIKSKLRSGIDLFYLSEIEFVQGRNYKTLTNALLINKFKNIRQDLDKLKIAYQIIELTNKLIYKEEKDEQIFNLLNKTFNILNIHKTKIIYQCYLWNLLSLLGYKIDLYSCVNCQKKLLPENLCFNSNQNGIVCCKCSNVINNENEVSTDVIKILRIFLKEDWDIVLKLKITESDEKSLDRFSEIMIDNMSS